MSAEESLAAAEADLAVQRRKHAAEQPVKATLDRLVIENNLADLIRETLRRPPRGAR